MNKIVLVVGLVWGLVWFVGYQEINSSAESDNYEEEAYPIGQQEEIYYDTFRRNNKI